MANEKRLIDAEQAKRATYEEVFWTESEQAVVRNFLAKLPKVDAVEVVRCKDCEYWSGYGGRCKHWGSPLAGTVHYTNAGDFCSYGERKEDG